MGTTTASTFVDAPRLAELLGLPDRKSVYYLIERAGLPHYRVGERRILFDPEEVAAWVRSRRAGEPS